MPSMRKLSHEHVLRLRPGERWSVALRLAEGESLPVEVLLSSNEKFVDLRVMARGPYRLFLDPQQGRSRPVPYEGRGMARVRLEVNARDTLTWELDTPELRGMEMKPVRWVDGAVEITTVEEKLEFVP